jgi:thiamine-phosphate pyrophosphorylase
LRSIEECLKLHSGDLAKRAETLRYDVYQLEYAFTAGAQILNSPSQPRLCCLLDARTDHEAFSSLAAELISAGIDWIQLRAKSLGDRELIRRGETLSRLTEGTESRWIMNDRADLAALCGAHGVHVGQDDLDVAQARQIIGPGGFVGVSTHSLEQAGRAVLDGASYLGVGPVFASTTKHFSELAGLKFVSEVAAHTQLPFFAIGGITIDNLADVLAAGATRVAVGRAIVEAVSPAKAVDAFRQKMQSWSHDAGS